MIIDGKAIADELLDEYGAIVKTLKGRAPCLAVVLVGDNAASHVYVNLKTKACKRVGIKSQKLVFPASITEEELLAVVHKLNQEPEVDGILVQMPLPPQIDPITIINAVDPDKDIDGFHPLNVGKLSLGDTTGFTPCTPFGIMELLRILKIQPRGKHAVVVGRSNIVGKPLATLLLGADATVTTVHSKTVGIEDLCLKADILISAVGKPGLITDAMIKPGAVVIDVGVNKIEDSTLKQGYRLVGDVKFEEALRKASAITPVPGGIGPMTIAMLIHNTLRSYKRRCDDFSPS